MSVGFAAVLFLVSLGYGLHQSLLNKITTSESLLVLDVFESKDGKIKLNKELTEKIQNLEGVKKISPAIQFSAGANLEKMNANLQILGANSTYLRLSGLHLVGGSFFEDEAENSIVLSTSFAEVLGKKSQVILGKEIALSFYPFAITEKEKKEEVRIVKKYTVVGIVKEDGMALANIRSLQDQKMESFSRLKVECASAPEMENVRKSISESGLIVSALSDSVNQVNKVFTVMKFILMLFGITALAVSAIGMFNTMTVTLLEKTEEIGIMKSIGASRSAIWIIFIMESVIMGVLGSVGGIVLGFLGGKAVNLLINLVAGYFGGESLDLFFTPAWFFGFILVLGAITGLITGIFPAKRASRIDPMEALRYK
jgi:putative ABC transport system permease protein